VDNELYGTVAIGVKTDPTFLYILKEAMAVVTGFSQTSII
jgi:hypothetical protein